MPPTRRSRTKNPARIDLTVLDALTVLDLRNLCREKKLNSTGNRNTLMNRLRDSGVIIPAPSDERTQNQPAQGDQNSKGPPPRHSREAKDNNFAERQLNSVRLMIQESVATASRDIATEAAMATVQALQFTNPATNGISPTSRGITPQNDEEQP